MADFSTQVEDPIESEEAAIDQIDLEQPMTDAQKEDVVAQLANTGIFKLKTEYILIGDEPRTAKGVVDLKTLMEPDQLDSLMKYLTFMPRSMLWSFFMQKIWPNLPETPPQGYMPPIPVSDNNYRLNGMGSIDNVLRNPEPQVRRPARRSSFGRGMGAGAIAMNPFQNVTSIYGDTHKEKPFERLVWAAFIDLFNEANLKYVNENQLEPWAWEEQKTNAYYISTSEEAINEIAQEIDDFRNVSLALDPKAKKIMEQYATLDKIGDVGLEINRQNAVKELLKKKEYETAQAIVDAYRYLKQTRLGETLTKPIPFNIVTKEGVTIAKAT